MVALMHKGANMTRSDKECFKCNMTKPLHEFYKHFAMADGHLNKCKECTKRDVTLHRDNNLERIRAYDRERSKKPDRLQQFTEYTKFWRSQDKRRAKAHSAVAWAIKKGTLIRLPCVQCGNPKSLAHHEDYDKPLDVVWLCAPCHVQHHKRK